MTATSLAQVAPPPRMGFPEARAAFLDYLDSYRGYSPHTVKAYACDLRWFQEFLAERYPDIAHPGQVHPVRLLAMQGGHKPPYVHLVAIVHLLSPSRRQCAPGPSVPGRRHRSRGS